MADATYLISKTLKEVCDVLTNIRTFGFKAQNPKTVDISNTLKREVELKHLRKLS